MMEEAKENIKSLTLSVGLIVAGLLTWGIYKAYKHFGPASLEDNIRNTSSNGMKRLAANRPMSMVDLVNEEFPGRIIINVKPDGACVFRAVGVCLWKSENHWMHLAEATNEAIIQKWDLIKDLISFPHDSIVGGNGRAVRFENVQQYHDFLTTEEASFIWRDSHDLVIMSYLLGLKIVVIAAHDDVAVGWHEFIPTSHAQHRSPMTTGLCFSVREITTRPLRYSRCYENVNTYAREVKHT